MNVRRIRLMNTYNTRDLGGYMIDRNRITKYNCFYRSDELALITEDEAKYLSEIGIKTVIDLRRSEEAEKSPDVFLNEYGIKYIHIPMFAEYRVMELDEIKLDYIDMVSSPNNIKAIFDAIVAEKEGAVLFHCAVGKDRTGIVAAMLLLLAGVDEPDIIADYQVSFTYLYTGFNQFRKKHPDIPLDVMYSKPHTIKALLDYIYQNGGIVDFLISLEVNIDSINEIKKRFVSPINA